MTVLGFNAETQKAGSRCQTFFLGVYSVNKSFKRFHHSLYSILVVWKLNGKFLRGSVNGFKIAPPSSGGGKAFCKRSRIV